MIRRPRWLLIPLGIASVALPTTLFWIYLESGVRGSSDGMFIAGAAVCWIAFAIAIHMLDLEQIPGAIGFAILGGLAVLLLRVAGEQGLAVVMTLAVLLSTVTFRRPSMVPVAAIVSILPVTVFSIAIGAPLWEILRPPFAAAVFGYFGFFYVNDSLRWAQERVAYNRARAVAAEFARVNTRVLDTMDMRRWASRRAERIRLAREIHDTVGYTLTAVLLQAQAAEDVIEVHPEEGLHRIRRLQGMIRDAIQEVRNEVHTLRDKADHNVSGKQRWAQLCSVFAEASGIDVHVKIDSALESVPEALSTDIYRIIQEAMINAFRHGEAESIDVAMALEEEERRLLLRISDNGRGGDLVAPGSGLSGIRERVRERCGSVIWQTQPGRGFDIGIEIPWPEPHP